MRLITAVSNVTDHEIRSSGISISMSNQLRFLTTLVNHNFCVSYLLEKPTCINSIETINAENYAMNQSLLLLSKIKFKEFFVLHMKFIYWNAFLQIFF